MTNMSKGRGTPWYGKLMTETLPSEVKTIWYSRDDELPPLPSWQWSFQHITDMEQIEQRNLLVKILEATKLTDSQVTAIEMVAVGSATFNDLAVQIGVSSSRAQQIYNQAIRKLRSIQSRFTGIRQGDLLCEIYTWRAYDFKTRWAHGKTR